MKEKIIEIKKGDKLFPEALKSVAPAVKQLYCIGDIALLDTKMAAVAGSRKCSEYGKKTAMAIGSALGRAGITVVSGMAKGIDNFGHQGVLRSGGRAVAVLGCGVDICYPADNRKLYERLAAEGLILSEYPPGTRPMPYMFPQRNRIIAGLAETVCIVEAGTGSGALITAELAADMGKTVYAVPGNITSPWSLGTNRLIADGALPLVVVEDLVREMGGVSVAEEDSRDDLSELERNVLQILEQHGEVTLEFLCRSLAVSPVDMNGIIMILEMKGYVAVNFGKIFIAKF
ncbi:MAG: DNA-processing protein DprA [Anaerovoracaceae bacterium]|nr:DNA-processing protein DprA [Anaerovoracaceae bacterium]